MDTRRSFEDRYIFTLTVISCFESIIFITGGLSSGKHDVYYYPPEGKPKCRSKPEMAKILGASFDLSGFDYSSGLFSSSTGNTFSSAVRPSGGREREQPKTDFMRGARSGQQYKSDNLLPPIRQTASIFKQPVTVVKVEDHTLRCPCINVLQVSEDEESRVKADSGQRSRQLRDKPRQLFWERRLAGISARSPEVDRLTLPESLRGLLEDDTMMTSIRSLDQGERAASVRDEDIRNQEKRVEEARNRLAAAIKAL